MLSVSVIVCTYNRPGDLVECVERILANGCSPGEVLVMDQSQTDLTGRALEALNDSRIRYVKLDRPGKSRAMNLGVKRSTGDILCFTDDDCLVTESWIRNILLELDQDQNLSAVYGQTLPVFVGQDKIEYATFADPNRRVYQGRRSPYRVGGAGGNMGYRRSTLLALGDFDENLGPGARFKAVEDNDYFYRTFCQGMKAVYSPSVVVYHKQSWTEDSLQARHAEYRFGDGAFIAKHLIEGDWHPLYYYLKLEASRFIRALVKRQIGYAIFVLRSVRLTSIGMVAYVRWYRGSRGEKSDHSEHPDSVVSSNLG